MPRRIAKPPYEIMNPRSASSASPGQSPAARRRRGSRSWSLPDASALQDRVGQAWSGLTSAVSGMAERVGRWYASFKPAGQPASPWWIGSSKPVVLRVSRGLVVGAVAGVVGLVLLAYWTGLGQGRPITGPEDGSQLAQNTPPSADPAPWAAMTGPDIPGGGDLNVGPIPRKNTDPRKPGLNYLVYRHTDLIEAERLQAFLADHGVRTLVLQDGYRVADGTDSGQTIPLYLVIDVTKGFTTAQYRRGDYHKFLNERLQLGQAWRRHNGNRGSALESMTFYKYDPQP